MLADEVTHVKMGSDWLRRLTEHDPERRERALEFQRVVDKLFSFRGFRGEDDENPIQLARTVPAHGRLRRRRDRRDRRVPRPTRLREDGHRPERRVDPPVFSIVDYDAARIAAVAKEVAALVGLPDDVRIDVVVDEQNPFGKTSRRWTAGR